MKKFRLKNLLKYTLAIVGVCCAMIAGVFAMNKTSAKADEVMHLTEDISIDRIDLVPTPADYYITKCSAVVYATINEDNLNIEHTSETFYNVGDYITTGPTTQAAPLIQPPEDLICSTETYYIYSIYAGDNESNRNVSFDTLQKNSIYHNYGSLKDLAQGECSETNGTYVFQYPLSDLGFYDLVKRNKEYAFFIDVWAVTETKIVDDFNATLTVNQWEIMSTKTERSFSKVYSSKNYIQTSIEDLAREKLSTLASDETANVDYLFEPAGLTGYTADTQVSVNVNYKEMSGYDVVDVAEQFFVPARVMFNTDEIINCIYKLSDKNSLVDFNCNLTENYYENGQTYETGKKVYLQAESVSSEFDYVLKVINLNVNYHSFQYKDFYLKISNNEIGNNLTLNYYTSTVSTMGNQTMLVFEFDKIEEHLCNLVKWLFDLKKEDFEVDTIPDGVHVTLTDSSLIISFDAGCEENLLNFNINVETIIMEDVPLQFTYTYVRLDNNLNETIITTAPILKMYSEITRMGKSSFYKDYGATIDGAISPAVLDGQEFYKYSDIKKYVNTEEQTCNVEVVYTYTTVLKLEKDKNNGVPKYRTLNKNSLVYDYNDLDLDGYSTSGSVLYKFIPDGYRIKGVSAGSDVTVSFNEETPRDLTLTINCDTNEKKIIPVKFTITDKWYLDINYLEQYKDTPFAVAKTVTKEIKVSDFGENLYLITNEQVAELLGFENLKLFKIKDSTKYMTTGFVLREKDGNGKDTVYADKQKLVYDGTSKYTLTLEYSYTTMRKIASDGITVEEIKIPLTCYADWCKQFNKNWSILFLNREDATWFEFSNEVSRDKLYGFFSTAIFEERQSDLNDIFSKFTSDGCKVVCESRTVTGSGLYNFYYRQLGTVWHVAGVVGMLYEEWADLIKVENQNKMLYTYFLYLDNTTNKAVISKSGAEDWNDNDSAMQNKADEILSSLNKRPLLEWWENSWFAKFLKIIGIGIICGLVLYIFVKLFKKML